jgi:hypothetical protein
MKNLAQTVFAPVVLAIAGCGTMPILPPPTPLEKFSQLEEDKKLHETSRAFRIEVGQLLGLSEVLKNRAAELATTNPEEASVLLEQVKNIDEMVAKLPNDLLELVQEHTGAAYRTRIQAVLELNASGIEIFDFSEREKDFIERLRNDSRARGARVAALEKEIEELRKLENTSDYQKEINVREMERDEIIKEQESIDGAFIDRNLRGEEAKQLPSDHWVKVVHGVFLAHSGFKDGLKRAPGQR